MRASTFIRARLACSFRCGILLCAAGVIGISPAFAADSDGDGVDDSVDICPNAYNPSQGSGYGDLCEGVTKFLENQVSANNLAVSDGKAYLASGTTSSVPVVSLSGRSITKWFLGSGWGITNVSSFGIANGNLYIGNYGNVGLEALADTPAETGQIYDTIDSTIAGTARAYSLSMSSSGTLAIGISASSNNFYTLNSATGVLSAVSTLPYYVSAVSASADKAYVISSDGSNTKLSVVRLSDRVVTSSLAISAARALAARLGR